MTRWKKRKATAVAELGQNEEKKAAYLTAFGTRNGNRTHNYPLGGGYYIHLTMQACY